MFQDILHLSMETPDNPFVAPVNIETIKAFMNKVGYQGVIDKTKINILQLFHAVINRTNVDYAALMWWDFINNMKQKKEAIQIEEDYQSIKDDIPLVSLYATRVVPVRGILISDAFLTKEIHDTDDFKEYESVFMKDRAQDHKDNPKHVDDDDDKDAETVDEEEGEVLDLVSQEFNAQAPKIIEYLFKNYVQSNVIQVHPITTTSTETTSSADLQQQLYFKMKRSLRSSIDPTLWEDDIHSHHDDHQEDDAPLKGEKRVKRPKASKSSKSVEETVIDEDEVIPEDETPELITELQDVDKRVPTIFNYERMKATLNDALSIEAHEPYSIVDKPSTNLIYLNNIDEKRVMYLTKIMKFCDATLEKVLKEVKLKIFQLEPWRKPPLISELDRDILKAFEREITKRLSHREQMRRWESFVNGRPILPTMKRL
ncbi:hypothetical protein Tco_0140046 [Tanacetum coccineum]